MKTVTRSFPLYFLVIIGAAFAGCYTEFAASESNGYSDGGYYADTDTSYDEEGSVIVNNNYYLDDDYRRSRFRLSFNYYYPTYHSSWMASYYDSYYNDYYWGLHRPSWYHHWPGCVYYPPVVYNPWWPPIYDPWYPYPYYPVVVYYPAYYNPPVYGYIPPANPGRIRDNGSTRDPRDPRDRNNPIPPPITPGTTIAGGSPPRENISVEKRPPVDSRQPEEKPWWEKTKNPPVEAKRPRVVDGDEPPKQRNNPPAVKQPHKTEAKSPQRVGGDENAKTPVYNPPKQTQSKPEKKSVDRSREERRSYSPPPVQQSPPQSAPPRNSGGNSGGSNNGGGRKRAD